MKNAIRTSKTFGLTFMLLVSGFFSGALMAQDYSKVEQLSRVNFDAKKSEVASLTIDVTEEYNYLKIFVETQVKSGDLLCEILDPKGKVIRAINVESSMNTAEGQPNYHLIKGELQKKLVM